MTGAIRSVNMTSAVTSDGISAASSFYYPAHNYASQDDDETWTGLQPEMRTRSRVCKGPELSVNGVCIVPERVMMVDGLSVAVNGFVMPAAVAATVVTNALVCVVLLRKSMRTPTNVLLVAMAVSDMMTGLSTMPAFIRFYTFGGYRDFIPYSWCIVYNWFTDYFPTIFHTTSVWLTVALAAQRYIYICYSVKAKRLCTVANIGKVIAAIYISALLSQLTRFIESRVEPIEVNSMLSPNTTMIGCYFDYVPFIAEHMHVYFNVYFWFRVVFIHFIPCTALVCFTGALSRAMQLARRRRCQLLKLNRRQECLRLQENNSTTLMLVVVVALFLLVEFPTGINMSIMIIENSGGRVVVDTETRALMELVTNLVIVLSYPLNFFVYCAMSRQFRQTFCGLFVGPTGCCQWLCPCGGSALTDPGNRLQSTCVGGGQTIVTHNGCLAGAWEATSAGYVPAAGDDDIDRVQVKVSGAEINKDSESDAAGRRSKTPPPPYALLSDTAMPNNDEEEIPLAELH